MTSYIYLYEGSNAQQWVNKNPDHRAIFNYKAIDETDYKIHLDDFLNEAMLLGYDIIIDTSDSYPLVLKQLPEMVKYFNEWIRLSHIENIQYKIEEWNDEIIC